MAAAATRPYTKTEVLSVREHLDSLVKEGGDHTWIKSAPQCCVRILNLIESKDAHGLFQLKNAMNMKSPETDCILIAPTTKAVSFPIIGIQYWPHVASCRLWRWPNLPNDIRELQPIEKYVASGKYHVTVRNAPYEYVCVNPFHYKNMEIEFSSAKARLECYIQIGGDAVWKERISKFNDTILRLIQLKDSRGLNALEEALFTKSPETNCILIATPKHNTTFRIQNISYWPHVGSCRLWRWPDLPNYMRELEPIEKYAANDNNYHVTVKTSYDYVCVNPFHYKKLHAIG